MLQRVMRLQSGSSKRDWEAAKHDILHVAWPVVACASADSKMYAGQVRLALYCMAKLGVDDADTMHRLAARASEVAN